MATLLIFLVLLGGISVALEYNHRRTRPHRLAGSTNFEDRDQIRVWQELRSLARDER